MDPSYPHIQAIQMWSPQGWEVSINWQLKNNKKKKNTLIWLQSPNHHLGPCGEVEKSFGTMGRMEEDGCHQKSGCPHYSLSAYMEELYIVSGSQDFSRALSLLYLWVIHMRMDRHEMLTEATCPSQSEPFFMWSMVTGSVRMGVMWVPRKKWKEQFVRGCGDMATFYW